MRERLRAVREQSEGQVIVFVAICMVVLIGMTGFALDIGHAYFVQRELQRSADAAALAAAQELPDGSAAIATAHAYSGEDGAKNETTSVKATTSTITPKCLKLGGKSPLGCTVAGGTYNTVQVRQDAKVPTFFARVLGINELDVHATATACSPCAPKPLDIMVVLDRTGSMCQTSSGANDPACTDLTNAKTGIKTFLGFMDPDIDKVGLAVLPPTPANPSTAQKCAAPTQGSNNYNYDNQNAAYVIVPLSGDFLNPDNTLNTSSNLVSTLNCVKGAGNTSYADAIEQAQSTLVNTGRPNIQDIIIFLSDGAANYGGKWHTPVNTSPYRTTPCAQGVTSSGYAKAAGTAVYSIGYDLNGQGTDYEKCKNGVSGSVEAGGITAWDAIRGIASSTDTFYNKPDPGQLTTIFTRIAADISRPASRLIDNSAT